MLGSSWDDPRTLATLAAAQQLLSGSGSSIQRIADAGMSYGGTLEQRKSVETERQRRMAETLLMQQRLQQMVAQQKAAEEQAQAEQRARGLIANASMVTPQEALSAGGGPTVANAERVGQSKPIDYLGLFQQGVPASMLEELRKAQTMGMDKVSRTIEVPGPNGEKMVMMLDDFGRPVGGPMPAYTAPQLVNLGDRQVFTTPKVGAEFKVGMSPAERDAASRGWASQELARARLLLDANKPSGDTGPLVQIIGPDGQPMWATRDQAVGKTPAGAGTAFEAKEAGKKDLDAELARFKSMYDKLNQSGGITSTQRGGLPNIGAYFATSGPGQAAGRMFGTQNQSVRDIINMARPQLLASIMRATGMSAKQLDSNAELKLWLDAATDPARGYEANIEAINNLGRKYGSGPVAETNGATGSWSDNQQSSDGWGIRKIGE